VKLGGSKGGLEHEDGIRIFLCPAYLGLLGLDTEYELNQINPNSATVRWRHSSGPGRNTATAIVAVRARFPGRPGEPPFLGCAAFISGLCSLTQAEYVRMYQPHPRNIGINKRTSQFQCREFRSQQLSGIGNNGLSARVAW
jgi:hypothetical protein